jgi:hypothetical protein
LNEQLGGVLSELFQRKEKCSKSFRKATRAGRFVAFWHHLWLCADQLPPSCETPKGVSSAARTPFIRRLHMVAQEANILATRELLRELPLYPKALSPSLKGFLKRAPILRNEAIPWSCATSVLPSPFAPEGVIPPGPRGGSSLRRSLGMGELGEVGKEKWRFWRVQEDALETARKDYGASREESTPADKLSWAAALTYSRHDEHRTELWQTRLRQRAAETMWPLSSVPPYKRGECRQEREDYFIERYGSCLLRTAQVEASSSALPQKGAEVRPWFRLVDPRWSWSVHGVSLSPLHVTSIRGQSLRKITATPQNFTWYRQAISPSCRGEINRHFGKRLLKFVCSNLS